MLVWSDGWQSLQRSACLTPKPTPLDRESTLLSCTSGCLYARMQPFESSALATQPRHPSLALAMASPLSPAPGFSQFSASSLPAWACHPMSTLATCSGAALLPGPLSWVPPTQLSRPLAAGPLIASSATLTSQLHRRATCHCHLFSALSLHD